MSKQTPSKSRQLAKNRQARHDYELTQFFEAGMVLQGWEIKSLRDGRAQLKDSYVRIKKNEAWLIGAHFSPLSTISTHITVDPTRSRKLLLHRKELDKLIGATERQGFTIVPLDIHLSKNRAKLNVALARGKKTHDKREAEKRRQWERERQRMLKPR